MMTREQVLALALALVQVQVMPMVTLLPLLTPMPMPMHPRLCASLLLPKTMLHAVRPLAPMESTSRMWRHLG